MPELLGLGTWFEGDDNMRRPSFFTEDFDQFGRIEGQHGALFTTHWHIPSNPVLPLHVRFWSADNEDDILHVDQLWVQARLVTDPGTGGLAMVYGHAFEDGDIVNKLRHGPAFN